MTGVGSDILRRLYDGPPEAFLSRRAELAAELKQQDQREQSRTVTALRKPTLSASAVNRQAWADPDLVGRVSELRDRLRDAQSTPDAERIRDLSTERRELVDELTVAALARTGQDPPSTSTRDEVRATFDAAVADPAVAAELGRLVRPCHYDGFGVAEDGASGDPPVLVLVRGGRSTSPPRATSRARPATARPGASAAQPPTADRPRVRARSETKDPQRDAVRRAEAAAADADAELAQRESTSAALGERVDTLRAEAARVGSELAAAQHELAADRRELRAARTRSRSAHTALDRARRRGRT